MKIHTRAPGRVNLIGDHTDYTGGLALPIAIDRWTEVEGEPSDHIHLVSDGSSGTARLRQGQWSDIRSLEPRWARYVAAVAAEIDGRDGIVGEVRSSLPVGAGLSSSASLELALALALGFDGSPLELARLGQRAEHRATGVPTGIMDQLCIATAEPGCATMIDCDACSVVPVALPDDMAIVVRHVSPRTLEGSAYGVRVEQCHLAQDMVGPLRSATVDDVAKITDDVIRRRAHHVVTENQRVLSFAEAMTDGDLVTAGRLMIASHESLRDDFEVSTRLLDATVDSLVRQPGVFGARMTGGGFGGCVVALCRADTPIDGIRVEPVGGASRMTA